MRFVKEPGKKLYLMDNCKVITLKDKAKEMGITEGYLRERLNLMPIMDAINPKKGLSREAYRPNKKVKSRNVRACLDNKLFYKAMKAISMTTTACGGL